MGTGPLPPDVTALLRDLTSRFSAYLSATTAREEETLRAQIIEILAILNASGEALQVRRARELMRRLHIRPDDQLTVERPSETARRLVDSRIRRFEADPSNPTLSRRARQLLRLPVVEAAETLGEYRPSEIVGSLDRIFSTLRETDGSPELILVDVRNCASVIHAFWKNFCNIPPFCSGRSS
jgi:hypothetical protein